MIEQTLPQLEQLINQLIEQNAQFKSEIESLKQENAVLIDEKETMQLEAIELEEQQKQAAQSLQALLAKLQSANQVD